MRISTEIVDDCLKAIDINALDFVLITYEIPLDIVSYILEQIEKVGSKNITVIVTPAPPVRDQDDLQHYHRIDYLVASIWEAQEFLGSDKNDIPILAEELLKYKIRAVCIPTDGQIYLKAFDQDEIIAPACPVPRHRDNTGERSACCAALAYQLKMNGVITKIELPFITSAMAMSTLAAGGYSSMPHPEEVEKFISRDCVKE